MHHLERGLVIENQLSIISENQLYEHRVVQRRRKRQQEVSEEVFDPEFDWTEYRCTSGSYGSWCRALCRIGDAKYWSTRPWIFASWIMLTEAKIYVPVTQFAFN